MRAPLGVARFRAEGDAGLAERSSRPRRCPRRTPSQIEERVLQLRGLERRGQDWIGPELGIPARTVSAILRRHGVPYLRECDPLTGKVIRSSKTTALRYEREVPGDLVHMDVKKLGRIPDGGGWRGRGELISNHRSRLENAIGSGSTTCTRWSMTTPGWPTPRSCPTRRAPPAPAFLATRRRLLRRPRHHHHPPGDDRQHLSYKRLRRCRDAITTLAAQHIFIRAHCPWQNGKVERLNRTLQTEWAYRQIFTTNDERTAALAPWLEHYNASTTPLQALGGLTPMSRLSWTPRSPSTPRRRRLSRAAAREHHEDADRADREPDEADERHRHPEHHEDPEHRGRRGEVEQRAHHGRRPGCG